MNTASRQIQITALLVVAVTCIIISPILSAADAIKELEEEQKRLQLESSIEELKANIAENKRKLIENEELQGLLLSQKEAEARKAKATAERDEVMAGIPTTETKALAGAMDVKNFGSAGTVVAVDLALEMAADLCGHLNASPNIIIYDPSTASGVISARLLQYQINLLKSALDEALRTYDTRRPGDQKAMVAPGLVAAMATGTIKALVDLVSLFKTNVAVSSTALDKSKVIFATALASSCSQNIKHIGSGYLGELDGAPVIELQKQIFEITKGRSELELKKLGVKKSLDAATDAEKKRPLQAELDALESLGKQVDGFLGQIRSNEATDKAVLVTAAKYLAFSKTLAGADILDFEITLEGLSITKENIFTGQTLRLSGVAILSYRLHKIGGELISARVLRRVAKPIKVDFRGEGAAGQFWDKNQVVSTTPKIGSE